MQLGAFQKIQTGLTGKSLGFIHSRCLPGKRHPGPQLLQAFQNRFIDGAAFAPARSANDKPLGLKALGKRQ
ncbi:hypothetical protein D3C71_1426800 [compost metagenome]